MYWCDCIRFCPLGFIWCVLRKRTFVLSAWTYLSFQAFRLSTATQRCTLHLFATGPFCVLGRPRKETGRESTGRGQAACTVNGENLGGPSNASLVLLNVSETPDPARVFHIRSYKRTSILWFGVGKDWTFFFFVNEITFITNQQDQKCNQQKLLGLILAKQLMWF